jgi:hypothetical protein
MDEIIKWLVQQLPLAAVVGVALYKVYSDGRADRAYMMNLLEKQYIMIIELSGGKASDHDDTLMKRP